MDFTMEFIKSTSDTSTNSLISTTGPGGGGGGPGTQGGIMTTTTSLISPSSSLTTATATTLTSPISSSTMPTSTDIETIIIELMKHSSLSSTFITTSLIQICDSKSNYNEEFLIKFAKIINEKLICESPLTEILRTLDTIEFSKKLYSHQQFDFNKFLIICRYLCSSDKQGWDILGLKFFSKVWKNNAHFQQQIIRYCIVSDWIKQIINNCTQPIITKKVPQIENLKCPIEYETDCQIYCWKYQCLCQILLELSDINQFTRSFVEEIFFTPLNKCPDLLVFALIECQGNHTLKETVMIKALLKFICVSHTNPNLNATLIIQKIWPTDFVYTPKTQLTWAQKSLLTAMVELYTSSSPEEQSYKLSKILDLSQDLKVLNVLLSSNTYSFVIDLACFASRREYLKLDKWLNDKIQQNGPPFLDACIQFLKKRCVIFGATEPSTLSLPNETYRIILNCLRHHVDMSAPKSMTDMEIYKMYNKFTQWISHNQFVNSQLPAAGMKPTPNQFDSVGTHLFNDPMRISQMNANQQQSYEEEFAKDIEEEADSYFQRIYNQDQPDSLTIDQFLNMLKKFKESSLEREKEIAACMIRNLFKEYPFLPQYPDKELAITGEIFGGIILNNFVTGLTKIDALKCVLKALNCTDVSQQRYFMFGQAALNKLKTHLKEFPQFCNLVCSSANYRDLPPLLIEYVEYGKQCADPPSLTQNQRIPLLNNNNKISNNQSNEQHYQNQPQQQQIEIPPSAFQDKVSFIINNLSQMNLMKKAEEFKELFSKDQYYQWFSHYFVMKRVGLESNYHELYATFMVKISMNDLSAKVLNETYRNIKILLRSNKETDNFQDRTLLKNLGNWLGLITLAQNKPILTRHLDLKNLLIEAYHKGQLQLIFIVPFVTKILMGSSKSRVFRPPCPWTMKLIKILVEIHSVADLKLNLKFEVELLCEYLELDLKDYVGKSNDLKNKELFTKLDPQLGATSIMHRTNITQNNIDSNVQMLHPAIVDNNAAASIHHHQQPQQAMSINAAAAATTPNQLQNYNELNVNTISNLSQSIDIQPNLQIIRLNPQHKNYIRNLIEKCVQDLITFVSDRVIRTCIVTTETLVKKDFAKESNAELMRNAAHKMMRSLVAGYSLISTQEPLLNRIQASLTNYFQANPINLTKDLIDSTIQTLINDNLELCVSFVQKTCIERAIDELDKRMKPDFEARQKLAAESGNKQSSTIPLKKLQIYEEMGRNIAGFTMTNNQQQQQPQQAFYGQYNVPENVVNKAAVANYQSNNVIPAANPNFPLVHNNNNTNAANNSNNEHNLMNVPTNQVHIDAFVLIYDKLIKHLSELITEFEYVHYTTDAMHQVLEILNVCKQNPRDHNTATSLIKNVINGLRELSINAENVVSDFAVISRARDFYLILLKALTDQRAYNHRFTSMNVTRALLEHWITMNTVFPDDLFDVLYRQELINLNLLDNEFHQILETGSTNFPMVLSFLKYYLNNISANHFPSTLDLLQRIVAMKINQQTPTNAQLIIELKHILTLARINIPNQPNNGMLECSIHESIVKDWITLYNSKDINSSFPLVVKSLNAQGVLKNDESISNFFKFFLEFCVERCYQLMSFAMQNPATISLTSIHLKCFELIDSYSVLVILFIKQSGNQGNWDQKFQFLLRILTILATTAHRDQEIRQKDFFSLTYYRILLSIFIEFFYSPLNLGFQEIVVNNDNLFEVFKFHLVRNYCHVLHQMCPSKMPLFTVAWLDFISHRIFIGKCLDNSQQTNLKTWPVYYILLMDLLIFLKPIIQSETFIVNTSMELYKGTLKLFLVLFHDFPEFLCDYAYNLCDMIPTRAVQLRNIILSANPINIPDVSNIKVDNLYEIILPVRIPDANLLDQLQYFPKGIETYLLQRTPSNFLTDLAQFLNQKLLINSTDKQPNFNTLINALTLCIDISAMQTIKTITMQSIHNSVHLEIFQHLLMNFDSQGRYVLINSMVDHLRYPNNETLLFICLLLTLFKDNNDHIREQIVRVLLERYITQRPHPWGVEYLINELFRNPDYKLMEHNFIKCVPEIGKYFSRSSSTT